MSYAKGYVDGYGMVAVIERLATASVALPGVATSGRASAVIERIGVIASRLPQIVTVAVGRRRRKRR